MNTITALIMHLSALSSGNSIHLISECYLPIVKITLNSYMVLFVTKHRYFLQMLISDTRPMGRVLDVVWYDLIVTFAMVAALIWP